MIVLDFFVNIYLALTNIIGSFLAILAFVWGCTVPFIVIYLLYKHRKNKDEIITKLSGIDSAVLSSKYIVFYKRVISPLDDKQSWIKSVADAALNKSVD